MATVSVVISSSETGGVQSPKLTLNNKPLQVPGDNELIVLVEGTYRAYWSFIGNPGDGMSVVAKEKVSGKVLLQKTATIPDGWSYAAGVGRLDFTVLKGA